MNEQISTARLFTSILVIFGASFAVAATLYPPTTPLYVYREPLQELLQQTPNIVLTVAVRNTIVALLYNLVARLKPRLATILLYSQAALQGFVAGAGSMPYALRVCTIAPHFIPELLSLALAVTSGVKRDKTLLAIAVILASMGALVEAAITPRLCLQII